MSLPENTEATEALKAALEPRILGQQAKGWQCSCGCIQAATATATAVVPAGMSYPGQETEWYLWSVTMTPNEGETAGGWGCGISRFIPVDELKELFVQYFGDRAGSY